MVLAFLKQKDPTMPLSHSTRSARGFEGDGENLAMKAEGAPNWEWAVNTEWVAREVLCMHWHALPAHEGTGLSGGIERGQYQDLFLDRDG